MSHPRLSIISRNYGSWSLRGWLLCAFAGLEVEVETPSVGDEASRAELLLLSPSYLVPVLRCDGVTSWGVWAITEFLHERTGVGPLLPADQDPRAHCRSVCGEMLSGFSNLRTALPMNVRGHYPGFTVWAAAQADLDRIETIWSECLTRYGGPYLFGEQPTAADAMYAPVCTRMATYDVRGSTSAAAYCETMLEHPAMREWIEAAHAEDDRVDELHFEF